MIVLEIEAAAPVFTNIPDNTPAVKIRMTAGVTSFTPLIIKETVSGNETPPNNPPTNAPKIRL
jgi:hypothetical protein